MKNKLLVLSILSLSLICTSCNNINNDNNQNNKENYEFKVNRKQDKVAMASSLSALNGTSINISYFNNEKVPFVHMNDLVSFLNNFSIAIGKEYGSNNIPIFEVNQNNKEYTITNKKFNTTCVINFSTRELLFNDYHLFTNLTSSEKASGIHAFGGKADIASSNFYLVNEEYISGGSTIIDLSSYYIDMPYFENSGYLPFKTFVDIFLSGANIPLTIINDTIYTYGAIKEGENLTPYGKEYYNSIKDTDKLSEYQLTFNYYETCLVLDNLYGLKKEHGITSFDEYFISQNQKEEMLKDSKAFDEDLAKLLNVKISDFHSAFSYASPYSGDFTPKAVASTQGMIYYALSSTITNIRTQVLKEVKPFEVVKDTAFITFDQFIMPENLNDVYNDNHLEYTSTLIKESLNKINSDDSIKNVVLDLSCNAGGMGDAAIDVVNAMLGYCVVTTKDKFTNSQMTALYRVDSNLDGVIDSNDSLREGLNKYVLTSRASFSSANLVSALLKEGGFNVLGETSGGGSCVVYQSATSNGTFFQMSGTTEICTYKNGRLVSVDDGVTPDYKISSYEKYFDREGLVSWIKTLY